jgi:hypothetical protein
MVEAMAGTTGFAELAVRAADLADRCEAAGCLVGAALLRGVAREVEDTLLEIAPPRLPGWLGGRQAGAHALVPA